MSKKFFIGLAIIFALAAFNTAYAQEQKSVAVVVPFDSDSSGVPKEEANVIYKMFLSEFTRTGKCSVVDQNSFDKIKTQQNFQLSDCSNTDKVASLGKALNANIVITGQIMKFRNEFMFILQTLDVNSAEVISSVDERVYDVSELFGKFKEICKILTKKIANAQNTVAEYYDIGDIGPGGGIVFYYSEEGFTFYESLDASPRICHYLECSTVELGIIPWCPCENARKNCNVSMKDGIIGAGVGKLNTKYILNATHHRTNSLTPSNCAAKACSVYSTETTKAGEWYLPSAFELDLIYKNLKKSGIITSDSWHWSSSQKYYLYDYYAIAQRFNDGNRATTDNNAYKYHNYVVRAVRAF